tara:strand:+ start:360 stop:611 length:252 start_codon:yes stop_codon:yes gene_type:complete
MADPENDNFFFYIKQFVIELLNPVHRFNDDKSQYAQEINLHSMDDDVVSIESWDEEDSINEMQYDDVDTFQYDNLFKNTWFYS